MQLSQAGELDDAKSMIEQGNLGGAEQVLMPMADKGGKARRRDTAGLLAQLRLAQDQPLVAAVHLQEFYEDGELSDIVQRVREALAAAAAEARARFDATSVLKHCVALETIGGLEPSMRAQRGWAHMLEGNLSQAAEDFEAAWADVSPEERAFVAALVSEVRRSAMPELAMDFASRGFDEDVGEFESDLHMLRGFAAFRAGQLDVARDEFAWLLVRSPSAQHSVWLARVEAARGGLNEAYDLFAQAIRMEPDSVDAWHGMGLLLEMRGEEGDLVEAQGALRQAALLSPYEADLLEALGRVLRTNGHEAQADTVDQQVGWLRQGKTPGAPSGVTGGGAGAAMPEATDSSLEEPAQP